MSKEEVLEVEGSVKEILPNATFKVQLDSKHIILAHISGKLRINNIRILIGDRVRIAISPYDMTRGRIVYRLK